MSSFINVTIICYCLAPFQVVQCRKCSFQNGFVKYTNLKSPGKVEIFFSLKKGKTKKEWFQLYLAETGNFTLLKHQDDVTTLYGRWIDVEKAKDLMDISIWWRKIMNAFFNKIDWTTPSETLGKRTILLHGKKLVERFHVDKFSKLKKSYLQF